MAADLLDRAVVAQTEEGGLLDEQAQRSRKRLAR